jgi:hypothetical protein
MIADSASTRTRVTAVALTLACWQLTLHTWLAVSANDPRLWLPHAVSLLHDLLLLALVATLLRLLERVAPAGLQRTLERFGSLILLALGAVLAAYPQLLAAYLATPTNLFVADIAAAKVFLTDYLGLHQLWPSLVALTLGMLCWRRTELVRLRGRTRKLAAGVLLLTLVCAILTLPRSPHPLVNSLNLQMIQLRSNEVRVVPSLRPAPTRDAREATVDTPLLPAVSALGNGTAQHVFLIVMESVGVEDFERDFLGRSGSFHDWAKSRATYFSNYHSTNLDSYTSLIAMLTAIQVPYRAYAGESIYEHVNTAPNLTRSLRARRYHSLFISTYAHQPFVPVSKDWNQIMDRANLPSLDGWTSLDANRMDQASEDRAALKTIVSTAASHPRSFILHELVYGHSPQWQAITGKTQLEYYDQYLTELLACLRSEGLDDEALLVIVSDHGDRGKSELAQSYRVPLLVVGKGVKASADSALRSHLDLPGIIGSYLDGHALPPARQEINIVGSTERWIYGWLDSQQQHILIEDARGVVLSSSGNSDATRVQADFQQAIYRFARRWGKQN